MNDHLRFFRIPLLIVGWLVFSRELPANPPVEGDQQTLQVVRDVQAANAHAFPRGRFKFHAVFFSRATDSRYVNVPDRRTWRGEVEWDNGSSYWDFHLDWDVQPEGGDWEPSERPRSTRQVITPTAKFSYAYDITSGGAAKEYKVDPLRWEILAVLPEQVWYNTFVPSFGSKAPWSDQFDPEFNTKALRKLVVERPDDDRIVVTRHATKGPPRTITCSLSAGGNVIKSVHPYWTDAPAGYSAYGDTLAYEWAPVGDGRFWLKRLEKTYQKPGTDPARIYFLEISEFDPDPVIPKNRFMFESLGVKDGTTVYVYRGREKSEYVQGKSETTGVTQEDLDRLAEEARRNGFAAPKP